MSAAAFWDILKESAVITLVVTALMLAIEAFNYLLKGRLLEGLRHTRFGQILASGLLGAIPGCAGGYVGVSMYARGMFSFGALLAMMVATTGDEAFLMLALFPKRALLLFAALLLLGIAAGWVVDALSRRKRGDARYIEDLNRTPAHGESDTLKARLLHILPHALRVFLWTFGVLLLVGFLQQHVDLGAWIQAHPAFSIGIGILVGLIPQSGPHMAFVTLFADGLLPLPVLVANCIVQEGHAGLPLLSESRSAWLRAKLVKVVLAAIASAILTLAGL
ncbi:MAG: arsenic efflux protein [Bacteroidales bacterium]|nr:arsenic efflux protein [Bacteroidales bacterium]